MNYVEIVRKYRDDYIRDIRGLIQIPSIMDACSVEDGKPFGNACYEALEYMLNLGKREGFEVQNIDGYAGVIAYGNSEKTFGILGHLDVVDVSEDWSYDPFGGEIVQDILFGRGVEDDKGPVMSAFYAMKILKDLHIELPYRILLIMGCNEESGMKCMEYYKEHGEIPDLGFTPDANFPLIYGEKGSLKINFSGKVNSVITKMDAGKRPNVVIGKAKAHICVEDDIEDVFHAYLKDSGSCGTLTKCDDGYDIEMEGISAHGALPFDGRNAAIDLLKFVDLISDDHFVHATVKMFESWDGSGLHISQYDEHLKELTMNVGILNINEGNVDLTIDIRYPKVWDGSILDHILETFKEYDYPLEIKDQHLSQCLLMDPSSEYIQLLYNAYQEISGDYESKPITIGGGTYAKMFDHFVAYGPVFPHPTRVEGLHMGECHQVDEGMAISDLLKACAIYLKVLYSLKERSI